ncbi:MAG: ATP-binding cassette domain-containing protein [Alphaproteobacteria bacterium]|nr:ATP-binding cassette domain-containing protein [Alphaproteobacteria bacterium]
MMAVVMFEGVSLKYDRQAPVLKGISFALPAGSFHYLMGASGSGKTSLIRLIYGGNFAYEGTISVFGRNLAYLKAEELPMMRQQMGVIFQDFYLLDHLTAVDNVALPLRIQGQSWSSARKMAAEVMDWIGLSDCLDAFPTTLSGGQRQRIVTARAIINRPRILIADEPTGNLDDDNALKLLYLFEELNKQGTTVLFATHSRELVKAFPHDVLNLKNGEISLQQESTIFADVKVARHA